ncbi:MAG: CooT family nickel-binding protein [Thermodesulfobacteriota bacterium]
MCQMSVVLDRGDEQEVIMENVTLLEVIDNGVEVATLFDEPKRVENCRVKRLDFNSNSVTLVPR